MPDFLHTQTEPQLPSEEAPASRPIKKRAEQPEVKEAEAAPPKRPSRFWVDYYGTVFLFLIASFLLAGFVVLRPLIKNFKALQAQIALTSEGLQDERAYLESLVRSIGAAQSIPPDVLANVEEALPRAVEIPKLLQTMALLAESTEVRLNSLQFSEPKTVTPAVETARRGPTTRPLDINLSMSAKGYGLLRQFLESLERNLRVLDVQTITVTGSEQTGELTYSVQIRTYFIESRPAQRTETSGAGPTQTAPTPAQAAAAL